MRGDRDILWKWVIIGDSGVGKTSILSRLCNDEFNNTFISTIGIDFKIKKMEIGGKNVTVQIWDTAGQERFGTITKSCYRGSVGVILVYDTNSRTSFEDVNKWLNDIKLHTGEDVAKILLGNKCDTLSTRAVSVAEGEEVANYNGIPFIETSAKTGKNIEKAFTTLAEQILGESITRNNNNNNDNNGEGSNSNGAGASASASSKNSNFSYSYSFTSDSTKANASSANPPSTKANKTNAASELDDPTGFRNHRNSLSGIIRMPTPRTSIPDPTKQQQLSDQSFQLTEQNLSSSNLNLSAKKSRCC